MKKIVLSAAILSSLVGGAFADQPFTGFYGGAGLSHERQSIRGEEKFKNLHDQPLLIEETTVSGSQSAFGGKLFAGYGSGISNSLYLGAEADVGHNHGAHYGIAARFGYVMSKSLPYLKVGYEWHPSMKRLGITTIKGKGMILGGGLDYALSKNVFMRFEYTHNFGSKTNKELEETRSDGVDDIRGTTNANYKAHKDTLLIGLGYRF
jgi:opacity protein-like surface antigen